MGGGGINGILKGHMQENNEKPIHPSQEVELNTSRSSRRKPRTRNDDFYGSKTV
jgi:hypothetical protein